MSGPDFRFDRRYAVRPRRLRRPPIPIRRKPWAKFRLAPAMTIAFFATITFLQRSPDTRGGASAPVVNDMLTADFGLCHTGGGRDCVVDGDTFSFAGETYRIADIDTPETHPARCAGEAALGTAATEHLRTWLNAGAFSLESVDRDADHYGRKLRIVTRDGTSVGDALIAEDLARPWEGRRRPWC